jgi:hypothetical protein
MKRLAAHFFAASLGLLFFAGTQARAGLIGWDYTWQPDNHFISADPVNGHPATGGITLTSQGTLTPVPPHVDGSSEVVASNITISTSATASSPDTLSHGNYGFTLHLTDSASAASGTVRFTGYYSGTFATTSTRLTDHPTSDTTASLTLGGHVYTVKFGPSIFPQFAGNVGGIGAFIEVGDALSAGGTGAGSGTGTGGGNGGGDGGGGNSPEPSTLLLACLGMSSLGMASWRKWRRHV